MYSFQLNSQLDIYSRDQYRGLADQVLSIRWNQNPLFSQLLAFNSYGQNMGFEPYYYNQPQQRVLKGPKRKQNKNKSTSNGGNAATAESTAVKKAVAKPVKSTNVVEAKGAGKNVQEPLSQTLARSIEPSNKGFEMMRKMGYKDGTPLGKSGNGIVVPISIELKNDRKGLAEKTEAAPAETKKLSKKQRKRLRNEEKAKLEQMQALKMQQMEVDVEPIKPSQKPNIKAAAKETKKSAKVVGITRKHSPIRAPTQQSKPVAKTIIKEATTTAVNKASDKGNKAEAVATTTKTTTAAANKASKPTYKRTKYTFADTNTPQQLQSIARSFREEIELLQLRLEAEATLNCDNNNVDHTLIVAKIVLANNQPIAEHTFEFIRTEMVGWIGKYQYQQLETPIFHSMTNNALHITIVCENQYAYDCLQQCVDEISQLRTIAPISVVKLSPVSKWLYCYDAVYAGIIRDPELFLVQVQLHKTTLKADRWIIVSHEVCTSRRETHFMFLLDEPSALALTYHHNYKLFICMQLVQFTLRGRVSTE